MKTPEYVAKHSAWTAVTFLRILFFWLIIPLIVMIVDIIAKKRDVIEFYDDCMIQKHGIFSKHEKKSAFVGVIGVSVDQSLWQRMFGYGDVRIDAAGKWDINTEGIVDPQGLKKYLETRLVDGSRINVNMF